MSKTSIIKRIEKLEQPTTKLVVAIIDASLPRQINVGGKIFSEEEYDLFKKNLPLTTQLYEVEIVENKPPAKQEGRVAKKS